MQTISLLSTNRFSENSFRLKKTFCTSSATLSLNVGSGFGVLGVPYSSSTSSIVLTHLGNQPAFHLVRVGVLMVDCCMRGCGADLRPKGDVEDGD